MSPTSEADFGGTIMKKFLTPLSACLLAAMLTTTSFAITRGTVVVKDEY